ncbi:MAG: 50S ribosome-binding GTPase [Corynebacterium sp.]|uniref:FeoB small GTPase domain-containing protein n=1 Tax=Corynebacterium sp. TaxID=1720 RepID=UPI0026487BBB|nr:FeoB small GTPase domain-containing protein [Corynebacterium sp.]MDN5722922.1 50S ribosome-binding GTPase [Corynebacterium sp.]
MSVDLPDPSSGPSPVPGPGCGSCSQLRSSPLITHGVEATSDNIMVALAGNPNTGKSTVFNALTGLRQHVGNWPGSTVSRAEGTYEFSGRAFTVVDLPGTYSLLSTSRDEDVARDFLLFGDPQVTVVVVDATRLQRNLNLVLQVLQVTGRVVVALNLMDEAHRHGIEVDVRHLTRELGVPVVAMSARRGEGVPELLRQVSDVACGVWPAMPVRTQRLPHTVARATDELAARLLEEFPGLSNARWLALRLLEGDQSTEKAVEDGRVWDLVRRPTVRRAG